MPQAGTGICILTRTSPMASPSTCRDRQTSSSIIAGAWKNGPQLTACQLRLSGRQQAAHNGCQPVSTLASPLLGCSSLSVPRWMPTVSVWGAGQVQCFFQSANPASRGQPKPYGLGHLFPLVGPYLPPGPSFRPNSRRPSLRMCRCIHVLGLRRHPLHPSAQGFKTQTIRLHPPLVSK